MSENTKTEPAAARLRRLRERAELTRKALAQQLRIDRSTLSRYESQERTPGTGPSWAIYRWSEQQGDPIAPLDWTPTRAA